MFLATLFTAVKSAKQSECVSVKYYKIIIYTNWQTLFNQINLKCIRKNCKCYRWVGEENEKHA